jgi:hypothetical protein
VSLFLRVAAVLALLRAAGFFFFKSVVLGEMASSALATAFVNGLATANLGFAFLFWRAAGDPVGERSGIYTALLVIGLRAVSGTYEVLYLLEGSAAVVSLIDMVASIALFVGILNALPGTLRGGRECGGEDSESRIQNSE